jgi:hypothetical protein
LQEVLDVELLLLAQGSDELNDLPTADQQFEQLLQ